jgi:hypothetical protein
LRALNSGSHDPRITKRFDCFRDTSAEAKPAPDLRVQAVNISSANVRQPRSPKEGARLGPRGTRGCGGVERLYKTNASAGWRDSNVLDCMPLVTSASLMLPGFVYWVASTQSGA